jgi:hypothetical protein
MDDAMKRSGIRNTKKPKVKKQDLYEEHESEVRRKGAKITNYGYATSDNGILSKTTHGMLDTTLDKMGNINHAWL